MNEKRMDETLKCLSIGDLRNEEIQVANILLYFNSRGRMESTVK